MLVHYNRKLNVLSRFLRDPKKAGELIRYNENALKCNNKDLFGSAFYKALHKRAKGHKYGREIKQQLGQSRSSSTNGFKKSHGHHKKSFRDNSKPFPKGPFAKNGERGGQNFQTKRRDGRGRGKAGYVQFFFSNDNNQTHKSKGNATLRSNTDDGSKHPPGDQSFTIQRDKSKQYSVRGKTTMVCTKLVKNHKRHANNSDSDRLPDRIMSRTDLEESLFQPQIFKAGADPNFDRNQKDGGEKGNNGSESKPGPVHGAHISEAQERWVISTSVQPEGSECLCLV